MPRRSDFIRLVVATCVTLGFATLAPAVSSAPPTSCGGAYAYGAHFAGTIDTHTNSVRGAQAGISYVNEALCPTSGSDAFSSYWVSVVGNDAGDSLGYNIYQVGVDKCKGGACPGSVPVNQSYYFYAYGRMASLACGMAVGPNPVLAPKGNAGAGTPTFQVLKELVGGSYFWITRISGSQQSSQPDSNLQTCWLGVDAVQIMNEVWDRNDQSGGSVSSNQSFISPKWNNGTWTAITRVAGTSCDLIDETATQGCTWRSFTPDRWFSWDKRWP